MRIRCGERTRSRDSGCWHSGRHELEESHLGSSVLACNALEKTEKSQKPCYLVSKLTTGASSRYRHGDECDLDKRG